MEQAFLELIKSRRSIRSYRPDAIPKELLDAVLEAGTYAPSAMGRQSATIVAVTDKAVRDELMRLNAEVMGTQSDPYYGAPVIVLVLAGGTIPTYIEDGSCVLENLMLAAHAVGLGSVWVNRERQIFDSERGKQLEPADDAARRRSDRPGLSTGRGPTAKRTQKGLYRTHLNRSQRTGLAAQACFLSAHSLD